MEVVTHDCENNMQEQQIVNTTTRRGRPPKNKSDSIQSTTQLEAIHIKDNTDNITNINNSESPDISVLMSTIESLKQQNEKLKQIVETVSITNIKPLITCSDEDINNLYINYITNKETALNNVVVVKVDGKVIIPKSYYVID